MVCAVAHNCLKQILCYSVIAVQARDIYDWDSLSLMLLVGFFEGLGIDNQCRMSGKGLRIRHQMFRLVVFTNEFD